MYALSGSLHQRYQELIHIQERKQSMSIKRKILIFFIISTVFLLQACATGLNLQSYEYNPRTEQDIPLPGRIAIMPPVAHVFSEGNNNHYHKGYSGYISHIGPTDGIIPCETVESKMQQQKSLLNDYLELTDALKDINSQFPDAKKTKTYKLGNNKKWDGEKGIQYENIFSIYTPRNKNSKVQKADDLKLNWTIHMKDIGNERNLPLPPSKALSRAFKSDYLLVPVIQDRYSYKKGIHTMFIIPLWYTYLMQHTTDMAFYLIEGETGQIKKASYGKVLSPTMSAANLQRITEKGDFMGTLSFKESK